MSREGVPHRRAVDAAYGMTDVFSDGAAAGYRITRIEWIAPKPGLLDHAAGEVLVHGGADEALGNQTAVDTEVPFPAAKEYRGTWWNRHVARE